MHTLLKTAIKAAQHAGEEILKLYETTEFETKGDGSPVTIADIRAHNIILEHLSTTHIPVLSEESDGVALPYPERIWIIDPLDGTKDFIQKNDDFCVMIGLIENGRPILGVIYIPVHHTLYYAEKGMGAFKTFNGNTTRITSSTTPTTPLRCIRSRNHFAPTMEKVAHTLHATYVPRGSMGIKGGVLIEDEGDYFFSQGKFGEWDVCAPEIIVKEAGGVVSDCNGNPLFYGTKDHRVEHGIIYARTHCYSKVLAVVQQNLGR